MCPESFVTDVNIDWNLGLAWGTERDDLVSFMDTYLSDLDTLLKDFEEICTCYRATASGAPEH